MKRHGMNKYKLSVAMGVDQSGAQRAFWKRADGTYADVRVSTIKRAARALGVSAGFLIDTKQVEL